MRKKTFLLLLWLLLPMALAATDYNIKIGGKMITSENCANITSANGYYWFSSFYENDPDNARCLFFSSENVATNCDYRAAGPPVQRWPSVEPSYA